MCSYQNVAYSCFVLQIQLFNMNTSKNLYVFILAYAFMLFGECNSILARHLADKMYELQSILLF